MRKRVDANQPALVALWRKLGGSWQGTHQIPGALDGIAGAHGIDIRVEIKDPAQPPSKRHLTPAELKAIQEWKGRAPVVWETENDVINTMTIIGLEAFPFLERSRRGYPRD